MPSNSHCNWWSQKECLAQNFSRILIFIAAIQRIFFVNVGIFQTGVSQSFFSLQLKFANNNCFPQMSVRTFSFLDTYFHYQTISQFCKRMPDCTIPMSTAPQVCKPAQTKEPGCTTKGTHQNTQTRM
jgi:hypothetical protein